MKKQVCMIAYSLFPFDARIRRESEALARCGYHVTFLGLAENGKANKYVMNGVNVIELGIRKHRGGKGYPYLISYIKFLLLAFWECTKQFLRKRIDIVHVHNMPNLLILAAIIPRMFGKKIILDIHDSIPETYKGKFADFSKALCNILYLEERVCCNIAQRIICVNDVQRDILVKRGISKEKISVLLNVPDEKIFKFDASRMEENYKMRTRFNLVYHGTVDRMLGIDLVIEAISDLVRKIPEIHFYILGWGKDAEEIGLMSRDLGIERHIHFSRKYYPVEDLPEKLKIMDLGIIPNRKNEATDIMLPVKMLEYIAIGIPVVAARLQTIERYFSEEMVTFCEPGDVKSMVDAIMGIYTDPGRRKKQIIKAKEFIEQYGWEKAKNELFRIYDSF